MWRRCWYIWDGVMYEVVLVYIRESGHSEYQETARLQERPFLLAPVCLSQVVDLCCKHVWVISMSSVDSISELLVSPERSFYPDFE